MRHVIVPVCLAGGRTLRIVLAGDFHWGSAQCQEELITKRFVPMYADEHLTRIIMMGDEIDAIWRRDHKRFEPMAVHERYVKEGNMIGLMVRDFKKAINPLTGQIDAAVDSNHNAAYRKHSDYDPHAEITKELGAERLGYGGYVIYRIKHRSGAWDLVFAVAHGETTATTIGGQINSVARDGFKFHGHIIAHGHTHQLRVPGSHKWFEWDTANSRILVGRQRIIQTGSFLQTYSETEYSPYGEVRRYEPADLGWPVVEVAMDGLRGGPRIKCYTEEFD